jgi:5-methylcytosine-specific restriction endonuclease McrA
MPNLPKKVNRSWETKKAPQTGRAFINPWYHTTRWRKLRALKLSENPLCVHCEAEGIITLAQMVDHDKPVSSGQTEAEREQLMWDWYNLKPLCNPCHNRKSAKESKKVINL